MIDLSKSPNAVSPVGRDEEHVAGFNHALVACYIQRQRISLARALLEDPAILILDKATAMFDPEGERGFISECHELLRSRTVLLITHRPASLALADRVLHLEHGQLR